MKKTLPLFGAALALASSASAAIYSTSFESPTYSAGALSGQDGWIAQGQWTADGAGNATSASGGFVRAQNTTVQSSNAIGTTDTVSASFTFGAVTNNVTAAQDFQEGMFNLGLTEAVAAFDPAMRITGGLAYEDDGANAGNIVLRGIGSDVVIGNLTTFAASNWTLTLAATKSNATDYSVTLTATSSASGSPFISTATVTPDAAFSGASLTQGVFQNLPSAGTGPGTERVSGTTVSDYTFETLPVPEPSTALLGAIGTLALLRRRRA